ncbi:outer membrane protein assembly factor BamE [Pseudooceanicola nanhaiensis]|uniref:outer membrane protein assembly factor BamE n=1 Tax=Pseudooceanicola nanhaiensis TaxID=375761 RepID=UPI001CD53785|nr:outer membrane protein assembly factor BamE [Pseudooceanicola nanhaiensis]MCA0919757.1 outer membrane protein assembly factor BamE [Pseudooceanicola nanhaiensis]
MTNWAKRAVAVLLVMAAASCTARYRDHGYVPLDSDLSQIAVGKDTRDTVSEKVGAPSTSGMLDGGNYYYVHSRVRHFAYTEPQVVEREVVQIAFDQRGVVSNVSRYGLEDGKVVTLSRRVTDDGSTSTGIIAQLLGNLGQFSASDFAN